MQFSVVFRICFLDISPYRIKIRRVTVPVVNQIGVGTVIPIAETSHGKCHPVCRRGTCAAEILPVGEQAAVRAALCLGAGHRRPYAIGKLRRKRCLFRKPCFCRCIIGQQYLPCQCRRPVPIRICVSQLGYGNLLNLRCLAVCSAATQIEAIRGGSAPRSDNGTDIIASSGGIRDSARIIAIFQHRRRGFVTSAHTAYRSGARNISEVIAVFNSARSPVLSGHASDIPGCSGHCALVVASADCAAAVDISDDTTDTGAAGHGCLIPAVYHLPVRQFADYARCIALSGHFAPNNQVPYRSAVDNSEKADGRTGRNVQSVDHMIISCKSSFERVCICADAHPRAVLPVEHDVGSQCNGFSLIGFPGVDGICERLQFLRRTDGKIRGCLRGDGLCRDCLPEIRKHGKRCCRQRQYNSQQHGRRPPDFRIHSFFLLKVVASLSVEHPMFP